MNLPIGSLMLFPEASFQEGWVRLSKYLRNRNKYPSLKRLGISGENIEIVKAGTINLSLFGLDSCNWIKWEDVGSIHAYPDLVKAIEVWSTTLTDKRSREIWSNALSLGTLPNIEELFIKLNRDSGVFEEGRNGGYFYSYPVIEHTDTILRPIGMSSVEEPKEVYFSISGNKVEETDIPANLVLLGQDPSIHRLKETPKLIKNGNAEIGKPSNITFNVLVCVKDYIPNIPTGFTWFIKYKD